MPNKQWVVAVPILLTPGWMLSAALAVHEKENAPQDVPKEVRALEGTYTGSWTMYGVNDKGEVVKRAAWTDTMRATGAQIKGNRALVTTIDEMVFEGGRIPPREYSGTEGYYLKADGALGDYFIESQGANAAYGPRQRHGLELCIYRGGPGIGTVGIPQGSHRAAGAGEGCHQRTRS